MKRMQILKNSFISSCVALCMMCGCDMLESHPYVVNISGDKQLTAKNITEIEAATHNRSTIKFAMISDTQRGYDETNDVVKAINARKDIDFVVHGGDLTEFGAAREFKWQCDILNKSLFKNKCE